MAEHTPFPWTSVPTRRRTSKSEMVDVRGGERGEFVVANYVREEDARVMAAAGALIQKARDAERLLNEVLRERGMVDYGTLEDIESLVTRISLALADVDGLPPANTTCAGEDDGLPF